MRIELGRRAVGWQRRVLADGNDEDIGLCLVNRIMFDRDVHEHLSFRVDTGEYRFASEAASD
jgi:hypothetical protein